MSPSSQPAFQTAPPRAVPPRAVPLAAAAKGAAAGAESGSPEIPSPGIGWLHAPPARQTGGGALLAIPPFAEEAKSVARLLGDTARRIAPDGWFTLLFDLFGTGDAPGDFYDATWERWNADVDAALDVLSAESGRDDVSILSIRASARLAIETAWRRPERVRSLVFVEPAPDTAAWLRASQRRSQFRLGPARAALPENDVDGFVYGPALWRDLMAPPPTERAEPPPGIYSSVLAVAPGGRASASMPRLAREWKAAFASVDMMPFWLESDAVSGEALATAVQALLI